MKRFHYSYMLLLLTPVIADAQKPVYVEVNAGTTERKQTPITVSSPSKLKSDRPYQVVDGSKVFPAQVLNDSTLAFILPDRLPVGAKKTYRINPITTKKDYAPTVTLQEDEYGIRVSAGKKPVFYYHTREALPPIDSQTWYRRSGFIHPLYSPDGRVLTDDFPEGHRHQHALFTAWTNTTYKKAFVDFWNQQSKKGTVEHVKVLKKTEGPVMAQLQVELNHKSLQHGQVLKEIWTINCFPFTDFFLFDLISEQTNITSDTLYLNKYHYGGLGLRGSKEWNPEDKNNFKNKWEVLTSEGGRDSAANHTHVKWVDGSGIVNGGMAGVTVFSHPSNFRYPQAIRVHATMPYFVYSPVVDGAFTINPGETYRSQYRYYVHTGKLDTATAQRLEQDYATPPVVKAYIK